MKNRFILKIVLAAIVAVQNLPTFSGVAFASDTMMSQGDFMALSSEYVYNGERSQTETGKGWSIKYEGQKSDRNTYFASITEEANFSSGKSMYIQYPDETIEGTYLELTNSMVSELTEGEYEVSFYVKGALGTDTKIYIGTTEIALSDMTKSSRLDVSEVPSGERNWVKYNYILNYTGENTTVMKLRVFSNTRGSYIDDVSVLDANGVNLIADSSFDGLEEIITEIEPFDTTDYQATRMMASSGIGIVGLSWRNPETTDLTKVSVYNYTDGENSLVIDSLSTTPKDIVVYPVTGLKDGKNYLFMIKFDFANGVSFKYYMSCVPGARGYSGMLGAWNVWEFAGGTATYTPNEVSIDTEVFHSGKAAMKFVMNLDKTDDPDLEGNNYIRMYQENLTLESNTVYEVKMWLKCQEFGSFQAMMDWKNFLTGVTGRTVNNFTGTREDWEEYTFTYDTTNGSVSSLNTLAESIGIMWIDDITVCKIDDEGNRGDNIILDGGFEDILDASVGNIEDAFVSDIGTNEITLNWESISSKIENINIYEKLFDNYEYRGTVGVDIGSVKVDGLAMGTEYSYKLVPVNSMGVEGESVEISFETNMPDYTIKEPVLKKGRYEVNEVSGVGTYTVTTEVKNYQTTDMEYLQCVAVYKDGALEKIYPTEDIISQMEKKQAAKKINTTFTIDESGSYSAKVYIFDNIIDMNSYIPKTEFE